MQASVVPFLGPIRSFLGMGTNDGDGDGDGDGNGNGFGLETWGLEYKLRLVHSPAKHKYPRMRQGMQWYGTDGSNGSNRKNREWG